MMILVYQSLRKTYPSVVIILFVLLNTKLEKAAGKHEKYRGWKSYYLDASTDKQAKYLSTLAIKLNLDFFSPFYLHRKSVVLVHPKHRAEFIKSLKKEGIRYWIHTKDVKSALDHDDQIRKRWKKSIARRRDYDLPYNDYHRLDVIYAYMHSIMTRYENITTLMTGGYSFEGRPIRYLKISTTNFEDKSKPVIFIDGAIHAREWITPPIVTWAIKKLTEDLTEPDLLNNYDWILLPVVNPDGYEYSFTDDRFWRKTRSTNTHVNSSKCPGVDGNRNFDIAWNTAGVSDKPCSNIYAGDRPFSESETRVVRCILQEHRSRIALYITMHSYGSMILYPWAYTTTSPPNELSMKSVAVSMADAIYKVALPDFPRYIVGSTGKILYSCSGTAKDYALHIGVPLTYTLELPGLSESIEGFALEPKHIEQVCHETWAGIAIGARRAKWLFEIKS